MKVKEVYWSKDCPKDPKVFVERPDGTVAWFHIESGGPENGLHECSPDYIRQPGKYIPLSTMPTKWWEYKMLVLDFATWGLEYEDPSWQDKWKRMEDAD